MRVYFVVMVSRQVEGDIISVTFEKCFSNEEKANAYYQKQRPEPVRTMQTEHGPIQFACERRLHVIDLED
jgi:hypothetical protein